MFPWQGRKFRYSHLAQPCDHGGDAIINVDFRRLLMTVLLALTTCWATSKIAMVISRCGTRKPRPILKKYLKEVEGVRLVAGCSSP